MKDLLDRFKKYWGKSPTIIKLCIVLVIIYCVTGFFFLSMPLFVRVESGTESFFLIAFLFCLAVALMLFLMIKLIENDNIKKARKMLTDELSVANLVGIEKRARDLNCEIMEVQRQIDRFKDVVYGRITPALEKERDWAIAGGIAEGLGGAAAGLATALELQQENAEIRERNAARIRNHNEFRLLVNKKVLPYLEMDLSSAKRRLQIVGSTRVDNSIDISVLMGYLEISDPTIYETENRNYALKAKVRLKKGAEDKLPVFERSDTAIDGCILAELCYNNQKVAYAFLPLPRYGVSSSDKTIDTESGFCFEGVFEGYDETMKIAMFKQKAGQNFTIEYSPYKLWAIEK